LANAHRHAGGPRGRVFPRRARRARSRARRGRRTAPGSRGAAAVARGRRSSRPFTYGWALKVPRAKQMVGGANPQRKRFQISAPLPAGPRRRAGRHRASLRRLTMSACTAEVLLRAAGARRKPTKISSKISTMPRSVQTARSFLSQLGVRGAGRERGRGGRCRPATSRPARRRSGAAPLQRVMNEHAGTTVQPRHASASDSSGRGRSSPRACLPSRAAAARGCRGPGCTSSHQPLVRPPQKRTRWRALRVIGAPRRHGLHHGLGAGHVERGLRRAPEMRCRCSTFS